MKHIDRMDIDKIIKDAESAETKDPLGDFGEVISILRDKGYSWRDIAAFLTERGVKTDHTKIYRFSKKMNSMKGKTMTVIKAEQYLEALNTISMTDNQKLMLKTHYNALNRSITYTELADAADFDDWKSANLQYGSLGKTLGEAVEFKFVEATPNRPGELFYSSSIGMGNSYTSGDFQLVMHHELAKAIEASNLF